jgi:hypothetical protein
VLFRASHHSAPLEIELTRRNIPFVKFGGLKFLEAAHVKDVLAFLRWAENLRDRMSGFRVIQLLAGPATAARLLDRLAEASSPLQALIEFRPPRHHVRRTGRHSPKRCALSAATPSAGRRNLIWRAGGICRICNGVTKMPECAKPIFCSSRRSPQPTLVVSASSPN